MAVKEAGFVESGHFEIVKEQFEANTMVSGGYLIN